MDKIKVSSGGEKTLEEVLNMPDGPKKKFWLLAHIAKTSSKDAANQAKELSCEEILFNYNFQ